ncbi:hypothetical protein T484DRAFT_1778581, partial [Baffinella frigidus]
SGSFNPLTRSGSNDSGAGSGVIARSGSKGEATSQNQGRQASFKNKPLKAESSYAGGPGASPIYSREEGVGWGGGVQRTSTATSLTARAAGGRVGTADDRSEQALPMGWPSPARPRNSGDRQVEPKGMPETMLRSKSFTLKGPPQSSPPLCGPTAGSGSARALGDAAGQEEGGGEGGVGAPSTESLRSGEGEVSAAETQGPTGLTSAQEPAETLRGEALLGRGGEGEPAPLEPLDPELLEWVYEEADEPDFSASGFA